MNDNLSIQLGDLVEQFISTNPNLKEQIQQRYKHSILKSLSYLDNNLWKKQLPIIINRSSIIYWLRRIKTCYSLDTIICWVCRVSNFFQFLKNNGYLKENPLCLLKRKYPVFVNLNFSYLFAFLQMTCGNLG